MTPGVHGDAPELRAPDPALAARLSDASAEKYGFGGSAAVELMTSGGGLLDQGFLRFDSLAA